MNNQFLNQPLHPVCRCCVSNWLSTNIVKIDNRVAPMALKLLVLVVMAGLCQGGGAIRCVCSSPAECEPLTDTDCPNGSALVWDPCGCCRVCARLEFEPCGGPDGFHGTCAAGLECVADHADLLGTCRRKYQFAKFLNWSIFLESV